MIAPSICKSDAVSRNIRAICLLSMPAIIFLSPSPCSGRSSDRPPHGTAIPACPERSRRGCALGAPLLSALCVNSSPHPLLSARCYLLSPLPRQPTNLLATQIKRRKLSPPPSRLDPNSFQAFFLTSAACGPLGPCTISNSTG